MSTPAFSKAIRDAGGAERFAAMADVSLRTVFSWQRDGVPARALERVATLTGLPPADLNPALVSMVQRLSRGASPVAPA